jgi:hypothetical protein
MKTHLLASIFAIALSVSLISCGGGNSGGSSSSTQALTPWTGLYDGLNTIYLPYANGLITTASVPTIYAKIGDHPSAVAFGMDTGSTGTVISPEYYTRGAGDTLQGLGSVTYSSSGIVWSGEVWRTTVSLMANSTEVVAQASVDVLVVSEQTCLDHARDCTPKHAPTGIHFMGIGFNSGTGFTWPASVVAAAANNPFTNLTYTKDVPLNSVRKGWLLTNQGVYLGMSSQLTKNFAFVKLEQNPATVGSTTPLWQSAPAAVGVNGVVKQGVSLVDTGVGEMLISPVAANGYPSGDMPLGVSIDILFPSQSQPQPAYYTFVVTSPANPGANPMTPGTVIVSEDTSGIVFVNTGRNFLQGFNYLYDGVSGYVGYGDNGNSAANLYRATVPTQ